MKKFILAPLAAFCLNWSGAALSADFVAVRIEAEDYTSKSERWALTSPDVTPDVQPDPDPPHNSTASGSANLELLPDARVTHNDDVLTGGLDGSFWGAPGGGPRIDYDVNVPEAGRYFVYVKTFSTGTEDNGIHVGVNGDLPESGRRIQICSKHSWFWTSGQRTDEDHCGVTKTIWLDFPEAGVNTVTFFAREDGFEIDQFLLLKETHDGTQDCFPTFTDVIRCRDVATGATLSDTSVPISPTVDANSVIVPPTPEPEPEPLPEPEPVVSEVDLDINLDATGATHFVDDTVEYRVTVTNKSTDVSATNVVATLNLPAGLDFNASADCTESSSVVTCSFGDLTADEDKTLVFLANTLTEGNHRVDAQVRADQDDSVSSNDIVSETITASFSIPDYEAGISIAQSTNATAVDGVNSYSVTVTNNGLQEITSAVLLITTGDGLSVQASSGCNPDCAVPAVSPGDSTVINFNTIATQSGSFTVTASLNVADDANTANNTASLSQTVVASPVSISENGVISIEAEAFSTASTAAAENAPQWLLVDNDFVELPMEVDPDNASPVDVSNSAYVELLPDFRIDDNSAEIPGVSNFSTGGAGSTLTYNVFFSSAGTYNVYARVRANNNQDARLHVGLNNEWPATAAEVTVCNPDGTWQWTNNVSNSAGCNIASSASITVENPGVQVLMVSQGTDGLELDKLLLSTSPVPDLSGTGPIVSKVDPASSADVSVASSLSKTQVAAGEFANYIVTVSNNSSNDAVGITVTIDGLGTEVTAPASFDSCVTEDSAVICSVSELAANSEVTEVFTIRASNAETMVINTSVSSVQSDANTENNSDQSTLKITSAVSSGTGSGDASGDAGASDSGGGASGSVGGASSSGASGGGSGGGGGSLSVWFFLSMLLLVSLATAIRYKAVPRRIAVSRQH